MDLKREENPHSFQKQACESCVTHGIQLHGQPVRRYLGRPAPNACFPFLHIELAAGCSRS